MLYNKHNLDIVKIVNRKSTREELKGVLFTKDKTVATDAIRLLEVSVPQDVKAEDFPQVEGSSAMRGCEPFLLNAQWIKDRLSVPQVKTMPVLNHAAVKHIHDNKVEFLTTHDGVTAELTLIPRIIEKFPTYEQLFPTKEATMTLIMDGEKLAELLKVMSALHNQITIKVYGKDEAVMLQCEDKTHKQGARAVMMPIRT